MSIQQQSAVQRWGPDATPTTIERRLYETLDTLGIEYRAQMRVGPYFLDCYVPQLRIGPGGLYGVALETDGCAAHHCPVHGYDDRYADHRRLLRDGNILYYHRIIVCHLWGHALQRATQATDLLHRVLRTLPEQPDGYWDPDAYWTPRQAAHASRNRYHKHFGYKEERQR